MEPVERHVTDELFAALDSPEFLAALAADEHAARRNELTRALSAVDAQRAELAGMWGTGGMTTAEWQAARSGIDERERTLRAQLAAVPAPPARVDIGDVRTAWPAMTLHERREFVRTFISRVTISRARPGTKAFDPGRVAIEWRRV